MKALLQISKTIVSFVLIYFTLSAQQSVMAESLSNYHLGAGDVISIQVYGEPELSMETKIRDQGIISYPFLGEIQVLGKNVAELEQMIATDLAQGYLIDPKVTVRIYEYRQFYINGEVKSPGGFSYQPEMTVRKAISLAGGVTDRASYSKISIVRDSDSSKTPIQANMDTAVFPGDILTVEESFF